MTTLPWLLIVLLFVVFLNEASGQCQDLLEISLTENRSINITTPNFPNRYDNNHDCVWHFTFQDGAGVTVRFFDFESELNYDKLTLAQYEGASHHVLHGNNIIRTLYLRWNELWVSFISDGSGQKKGFNMQVTAAARPVCLDDEYSCVHQTSYITCVDAISRCDTIQVCDDGSDEQNCGFCFDQGANLTADDTLTITTPGYPIEYPLSIDCFYYIQAPPDYQIVITIIDFNIEWIYDVLHIKPTSDSDYASSLVLHGVRVPDMVYTDSDEVWLRFDSDGYTAYSGFKIELSLENRTVPPECDPNQWPCFQTHLTCFKREYLCDGYQECPSGIDEANCAGVLSGNHDVVSLADGQITNVSSPAFPLFYPANIDIEWQILSPSSEYSIRLVFVDFLLAIDEDFLYIQSSRSNDLRRNLRNLTGSEALGVEFLSESPELWLRFVAGDGGVQVGMGFNIQLSVEGGSSTTSVTEIVTEIITYTEYKTEEVDTTSIKEYTKSIYPSSCASLRAADSEATSGRYTIDPDGKIGSVKQFPVTCNMSTGATIIGHDGETRGVLSGSEEPGGISRHITYDVTMKQIVALMDVSDGCRQQIRMDCYGVPIFYYNEPYAWWVSRTGDRMLNWGPQTGIIGCPCSLTSVGCDWSGEKCNCDSNDYTWRTDEGELTDKNYLPVIEIRSGDNGFGEEAKYTLGPLECI